MYVFVVVTPVVPFAIEILVVDVLSTSSQNIHFETSSGGKQERSR